MVLWPDCELTSSRLTGTPSPRRECLAMNHSASSPLILEVRTEVGTYMRQCSEKDGLSLLHLDSFQNRCICLPRLRFCGFALRKELRSFGEELGLLFSARVSSHLCCHGVQVDNFAGKLPTSLRCISHVHPAKGTRAQHTLRHDIFVSDFLNKDRSILIGDCVV